MVHWPKTIVANVVTIAIALIAGLALVQSAIALSGSYVWISLAVAALVVFVAVVVHRRPRPRAIWPWPTPRRSRTCSLSGTAAGISRPRGWDRPSSARGSTPPSSAENAGGTGVNAVVSV